MPCSSHDFDWNAATIARLRLLWDEGYSAAEIGRRLGVSKNAVVGKSHRLDLPARPSPIRRDGIRKPTAPRRAHCPTLPELQHRPPNPKPSEPVAVAAKAVREAVPAIVPPAPIVREAAPAFTAIRGTKPCCWPIGEPGTRAFRFCNVPNEAGKPYCPEHCAIAYRKKESRQKAA